MNKRSTHRNQASEGAELIPDSAIRAHKKAHPPQNIAARFAWDPQAAADQFLNTQTSIFIEAVTVESESWDYLGVFLLEPVCFLGLFFTLLKLLV